MEFEHWHICYFQQVYSQQTNSVRVWDLLCWLHMKLCIIFEAEYIVVVHGKKILTCVYLCRWFKHFVRKCFFFRFSNELITRPAMIIPKVYEFQFHFYLNESKKRTLFVFFCDLPIE